MDRLFEMNWANLPHLATEKIIFFAAKKDHKSSFFGGIREFVSIWEERDHLDYYVDMWIEILYKYGQVCPQWKSVILESKMLSSHKTRDIYMLDRGLTSVEQWEGQFSLIREGYLKIANRMRFWFGPDTVQRLQVSVLSSLVKNEIKIIFKMISDFVDDNSVKFYGGEFDAEHLDVLGDILTKSKQVERVEFKLRLYSEAEVRAACENLIDLVYSKSMKEVEYKIYFEVGTKYDFDKGFKYSLDLGSIEKRKYDDKNGHVDKIEVVLKLFGELKHIERPGNESTLRDEKMFTYDDLNKSNMSDFVHKLIGTYKS